MRRRDFIKVVGGSAVTWPLAARAQQQYPMPVMAFLKSTTPDDSAHLVRAFRQGLSEAGFAEGRNVTIEYRWAENQLDRLPELVAELVRRGVAVNSGRHTSDFCGQGGDRDNSDRLRNRRGPPSGLVSSLASTNQAV